ncbi:fungal-specific transcription factor domain-containing protein, partial [Thelonectria olida]
MTPMLIVMAGTGSDKNDGSVAAQNIPPIEIGSFVSLPPDDSEFIGSASGVFFVDTVFRAFARAASTINVERTAQQDDLSIPAGIGVDGRGPNPGTAHTYLVAQETETHDVVTNIAADAAGSPSTSRPGGHPYGVNAPVLGVAPPPATAQQLIAIFFRHWHPFFPFLHGPTFLEEVNRFYSGEQPSDSAAGQNPSQQLGRAVLFQCVFNIAASTSRQMLDPSCRIQSTADLVALVGMLMTRHEVATLQALLAAELYLTTCMSLRDASTIHGALTRAMFNAGFHRCPSRYLQLPSGTSEIRKRIFWCTFVLDRFIGQALGHPFSIQDADVDVCIPGMAELHNPAGAREPGVTSQSTINEQVLDHLPDAAGHSPIWPVSSGAATSYHALSAHSPARNYTAVGKAANELALSYLVTYSRLLGEIVHLFHRSIHTRRITTNSIEDITFQIHRWWNSLPAALQDDAHDIASGSKLSHSIFFNMLYNYLILVVNRPFLSLPPDRRQFHSSLQAAISASRNIIAGLKQHTDDRFLMAWPVTLSATWMAGLVLAFGSLLELYPVTKADSDIRQCLAILEIMASRWASARHCYDALRTFLRRLKIIVSSGTQE